MGTNGSLPLAITVSHISLQVGSLFLQILEIPLDVFYEFLELW
jgi:hypothetical protein